MNDDRAFRRVAIRHDVLPLLDARSAERDLVPVLARQADILRSESEYLDELAARGVARATTGHRRARSLALPVPLARRARPAVARRAAAVVGRGRRACSRSRAGDARATELAGGRAVRRPPDGSC